MGGKGWKPGGGRVSIQITQDKSGVIALGWKTGGGGRVLVKKAAASKKKAAKKKKATKKK